MSQKERAQTPLFMDLILNSCIHQSRLPTSCFIPRSPTVIPLNSSCQQQAICLPAALLLLSVSSSSSSSSIMLARLFVFLRLLSGCSYTIIFLCFVTEYDRASQIYISKNKLYQVAKLLLSIQEVSSSNIARRTSSCLEFLWFFSCILNQSWTST
jgi:hypothetical protein